jgi:Flp pilus assembly secretin CpaC
MQWGMGLALTALLSLYLGPVAWGQSPQKTSPPRTLSANPVKSVTDWRNAGNLMKRARQAVTDGNLDLAEWYVSAAERLNLNWETGLGHRTDTPKRLRDEIAKARGVLPAKGSSVPSAPQVSRSLPPPSNPVAMGKTETLPESGSASGRGPKDRSQVAKSAGGQENSEIEQASYVDDVSIDGTEIEPVQNPEPPMVEPVAPASIIDPANQGKLTVRGEDAGIAAPPSTDQLLKQAARIQVGTQSQQTTGDTTTMRAQSTPAARPSGEWQAKKAQALGYLAESRAALERGDIAMAEQFAKAAQELKVPDMAYEQGDPRPWMLLMDISKLQDRLSSQQNEEVAAENFSAPPIPNPLQEAYAGYDELQMSPPPSPSFQSTGPVTSPPANATPYVDPRQYPATVDPRAQVQPPPMASAVQVLPQGNYDAGPMMIPNATVPGYGQGIPAAPAVMPNVARVTAPNPPRGNASSPPPMIPSQAVEVVASTSTERAPSNIPLPSAPPSTSPSRNQTPVPVTTSGNASQRQVAPRKSITKAPPQPRPELENVLTAALQAEETDAGATLPEYHGEAESPLDPAPMVDLQPPEQAGQAEEQRQPPQLLVVESDPPRGRTPPSRQPRIVAAPPTVQERSPGLDFYDAGLAALENRDLAAAEDAFRKAWRYESDFDDETRQRLQDHLQMLDEEVAESSSPLQTPIDDDTEETNGGPVSDALRQIVSDVANDLIAVRKLKETDPSGAWDSLQELRSKLEKADLSDEHRRALLDRVDRQAGELEEYIAANRARLENDQRNKAILEEIERRQQQRTADEGKIATLVEQFNDLMDQQRYPEAMTVAKQAREIAPRNPVVIAMVEKGQIARQVYLGMMRNERFGENALRDNNSVLDAGVPPEGDYLFPGAAEWNDLRMSRADLLARQENGDSTEAERQIQKALRKQINMSFTNEPLGVAMERIGKEMGINIYLDPEGLMAEGITSEQRVSLPKLPQPISLRSALNLMLEPLHLSYVPKDEVLRITSEDAKSGTVVARTYNVTDLVIPIPNFVPNNNVGLPGALREAHNLVGQGILTGAANSLPMGLSQLPPFTISSASPTMGTGQPSASILAQLATSSMPGLPSPPVVGPGYSGTTAPGGGSQADFGTLINLIQTTIEPDSWQDTGSGTGTIGAFPTNLSIVVTNTQEVHEKIVDLLKQLRRLQDLQVTIEVRFITLNDSFFERIGVDFDFDLDDNTGLSVTDVQALDDSGPSITVGLDPFGVVTPDLDVRFSQGGFGSAQPPFGRFDASSVANIGFAILSDIEAFFLIQAAQGDERSNVLQAPKVTLFDGQTASVSDVSQRPFVTSVIPVVGDFAAAHQPVITVLTEGTTLSVNAVVSSDRRFVRLTLVPFFSRIGNVDTFTFEGRTDSDTGTSAEDPTDDTQTVQNNRREFTEGTTVQLPTLAFTTVTTTVSVPDGGTILLGGIKRLSEGRNERGVPMLSKVPYVNRLFKNVGIGRETQSLMLMVTPRIIIQEEEEEKLGTDIPSAR